ncbi:MAG TPA: bile acid:sodium symporter, partial [Rhizobiaceae bacterium]|nr:bile acid:sodium symporter [Rhizobiaceae bacterium]
MDIFIAVFLPATLAIIMFSLGVGLQAEDFVRVFTQPKAFAVGVATQILAIPVVAFSIVHIFGLSASLALGVMILAFCPSGVTSNFLTKVAKGDVALAVSLTGVSTLLSVLVVPFMVKFAADYFLGTESPEVNVTAIGLQLFMLTAVPVVAGIALRHYNAAFAIRLDRPLNTLSTVLFAVVVLGALASNWSRFVENLPLLGPSLISLNVVLLAVGLGLALLAGLSASKAATISIESGVHNATLGIQVGSILAGGAITDFSLPSGLYGV